MDYHLLVYYHLHLTARGAWVPIQQPDGVFLCGICTVSLCLLGFVFFVILYFSPENSSVSPSLTLYLWTGGWQIFKESWLTNEHYHLTLWQFNRATITACPVSSLFCGWTCVSLFWTTAADGSPCSTLAPALHVCSTWSLKQISKAEQELLLPAVVQTEQLEPVQQ